MSGTPWSFYVALDGPHLDGLIGLAGMLRFDWPDKRVTVEYYDGVSGGHNVSMSPSGRLGLLGNFSQQLVVVDMDDMTEVARQTTMAIERVDYRLRANTHHLWIDERRFIGAVGDHLYRFDTRDLAHPDRLGPHKLFNAHELRWDATRRYILIGDLGPEDRAAKQIAVFDLETGACEVIRLPDTCWHVCVHPDKPLGYAATYSVATEDENYVDWAPAFRREYVFEIDLPTAQVHRTWSAGAEFPIHLNSDLEVHGDKLYVSSGGSHTVVEFDLADFRTPRVLDCRPPLSKRTRNVHQEIFNFIGALARRPTLTNTHYILQALLVAGGQLQDGVYACRVSPDGKYLVTGNRGYNTLTVWDRTTFEKVYSTQLPRFGDAMRTKPFSARMRGYFPMHLGLHHSVMRGSA